MASRNANILENCAFPKGMPSNPDSSHLHNNSRSWCRIYGFLDRYQLLPAQGRPCSNRQKLAVGILSIPLLICMVIEMCLAARLSPNFDPSSEDYCSKMFYDYLVGKKLISAVAIILAALLYFPGSVASIVAVKTDHFFLVGVHSSSGFKAHQYAYMFF
ncbi:unnamed protein product [Larinioides sclopetarius]|uniref:Uncharacterized protein n=1 Tax=Larinioides sclopetarius TaxID=280406 RepID=A0AAV2BYJ8_9ARAC